MGAFAHEFRGNATMGHQHVSLRLTCWCQCAACQQVWVTRRPKREMHGPPPSLAWRQGSHTIITIGVDR